MASRTPRWPEHRVDLGDALEPQPQRPHLEAERCRGLLDVLVGARQELVQRRIEQPHRDRPPLHGREDRRIVAGLEVDETGQRLGAVVLVLGEDQAAQRHHALVREEHVLGAGQPDALGAEAQRRVRRLDRLGIGAHLDAAGRIGPAEQLCPWRRRYAAGQRQRAAIDRAVGAIDGEAVAGRNSARRCGRSSRPGRPTACARRRRRACR